VLRKLLVLLLPSVLIVGTGAVVAAATAYTPDQGAAFNNPRGTYEAKNRLAIKLRKTINSAPRNSIIRIAVYSFDRKDLGDALVQACNRKVTVQVVINDNWISGQVKRLKRKLGSKIDPRYGDACHPRKRPADPTLPGATQPYPEPSFLKICYQACRMKGPGNQHMKIYMFSQAGTRSNVIMVGSNNMTHYAASTHWNDMYTAYGNKQMFIDYSKIIRELAEDRPAAKRYQVYRHGDYVTEFGALEGASRSQDPVGRRLDAVRCKAVGGTGSNGRTVIRISMYAWVGDRGVFLARKVAGLSNRGCIVRAILSQPAQKVKQILRSNGVAIRSADLNTDYNEETGFGETPWEHFTHEKWMTLNGTYKGSGQRIVWTGSENWSNKSLQNDEVTLMIPRAGAHNSYVSHFESMWRNKRYTRSY
jgi:phosphatidylserine/phosphatidylglycerophosphate/cardiolipin synthase-like enzyme